MDKLFERFCPRKGLAMQHQITAFVRDLIANGELQPEVRLPTIRKLADTWETNYYTVQAGLSPLVNEGLLMRRQRLGTFVKPPEQLVGLVGIYQGEPLSHPANHRQLLHLRLCERLSKDGAGSKSWFETRPLQQQKSALPEIAKVVREGKVQALIAIAPSPQAQEWLAELEVPVVCQTDTSAAGTVGYDYIQFMDLALQLFGELGCREIGVITQLHGKEWEGDEDTALHHLVRQGERHGFCVRPEWIQVPSSHDQPAQDVAMTATQALWSQPERPAGLLVYPDTLVDSVCRELSGLDVRREDITLLGQRDQAFDWNPPAYPVDWIISSMLELVEALMDQLHQLLAGEPTEAIRIPFGHSNRSSSRHVGEPQNR